MLHTIHQKGSLLSGDRIVNQVKALAMRANESIRCEQKLLKSSMP